MAKKIYPTVEPTISKDSFTNDLHSALMYNRNEMDSYTKFSRYLYVDPYNSLTSNKEYVFFTKPNLHLFENNDDAHLNKEIANIPLFMEAHSKYRPALRQLQRDNSIGKLQTPFMNLLTDSIRSSVDLPTITADKIETSANVYGTNISYMWASYTSDEGHDFSVEFEDTKFLEVYMLFKLWNEYSRKKSLGLVTPPNENYIWNKELHDQVALYKFIVGEDNETIIHYSKMYGVYPTSAPREVFGSLNKDGNLNFTVSFHAEFVEDMEPLILTDFNDLTKGYASNASTKPVYKNGRINGDWVTMPFIRQYDTVINKISPYKLKWR